MRISSLVKKDSSHDQAPSYSIEKKCLYCGRKLENTGSYLYYQSFCSENCKEKYIIEVSGKELT